MINPINAKTLTWLSILFVCLISCSESGNIQSTNVLETASGSETSGNPLSESSKPDKFIEPQVELPPADIRRLTEEQYRNIIADIFGEQIIIGGRFDPLLRTDGLLATGSWSASMTPAGMLQYEEMARSIAKQLTSTQQRRYFIPCEQDSNTSFNDDCATQFLAKVGRMLFRRPLSTAELSEIVSISDQAAKSLGNFYDGLSFGLARLMIAPEFLFVMAEVEPDPEHPGAMRLDAFSKASRLSFFLWNTAPDEALLLAAESGELHTDDGLNQQVKRMISSPRLKTGIRAFFADMLEFSEFEFLEKDTAIYPAFGPAIARDAKEQSLLTITDLLINQNGDYRDLFTTKKTFINRNLGMLYRLPVKAPQGVWEDFEFPSDDPRAGIQTHLSFLTLNSHPGRSSPTLRGLAIRDMFMCIKVPDPPSDVDFSGFHDENSPNKTARQRLIAHANQPACSGCHRLMDPIGLALENYDSAGQFRTTENGAVIDTSGDLDGRVYDDSIGLGAALHDSPAVPVCLVNRLAAYAVGPHSKSMYQWLDYLEKSFTLNNYSVTSLIEDIATSKSFYAVSVPDDSGYATKLNTIKPDHL